MRSGEPLHNPDGSINNKVASILKKVSSLSGGVSKWAASGFSKVSSDQLTERLDICKGCEFWNASAFGGTGSCKKCGCSTQAKLRMATSSCPAGKW